MTEEEWDDVVRAHLKGHFVPTRWAAACWRERAKAGDEVQASVVCTTSTSGLFGNPGQSNYGAAKAGIAAFTVIAAAELAQYGVRVNAVAPLARTRLTESVPGAGRADGRRRPTPTRSTRGTRPTSPRWWPGWPRRAARSPAGCSWPRAARCSCFRPWSVEATVEQDGPLVGRPSWRPRSWSARFYCGDVADAGLGLVDGVRVGRGQLLEGGDELGHVALDPHLAVHERLHARLQGAVDEDGLGRGVVEGDGDVGLLEVPGLHLQRPRRGVEVGVERCRRRRGRR